MVLTVLVTIISIIIIFVEKGRWTGVRCNFNIILIGQTSTSYPWEVWCNDYVF